MYNLGLNVHWSIIHSIWLECDSTYIVIPKKKTIIYEYNCYFLFAAHIARQEANLLNVDLGDPNDKDCDGIPDHIDNDLDNDGKIDRTQDSDMDGLLNHIDEDDDNDGRNYYGFFKENW